MTTDDVAVALGVLEDLLGEDDVRAKLTPTEIEVCEAAIEAASGSPANVLTVRAGDRDVEGDTVTVEDDWLRVHGLGESRAVPVDEADSIITGRPVGRAE